MSQLLPPPTPTRDYSRDDDSDSDVSEDSAGASLAYMLLSSSYYSNRIRNNFLSVFIFGCLIWLKKIQDVTRE